MFYLSILGRVNSPECPQRLFLMELGESCQSGVGARLGGNIACWDGFGFGCLRSSSSSSSHSRSSCSISSSSCSSISSSKNSSISGSNKKSSSTRSSMFVLFSKTLLRRAERCLAEEYSTAG